MNGASGLSGLLSHFSYFVTVFLLVAGLFIVIARGNLIKKRLVLLLRTQCAEHLIENNIVEHAYAKALHSVSKHSSLPTMAPTPSRPTDHFSSTYWPGAAASDGKAALAAG